ncbi:MAG: dihydrofolate reductase [Bacteroidales bacterium]|jgi:dihydrofolate reductase|nr:dihydrofolate reductase [Bacteroidales bacterium]
MLSIIVAIAENGAIGKDNDLIWHLSDDLKRFKALTTSHTVIMGRKTFESLPKGALPNRTNVVLTKDKNKRFPNCIIINSIQEIVRQYQSDIDEHFVIGGSHIYKALLPFANRIYLTRVHHSFDADVFFPEIKMEDWKIENEEKHSASEKNEYDYSFINLVKK